MLGPQDVFRDFDTFKMWFWEISQYRRVPRIYDTWGNATVRSVWDTNYPCVPGSYGCTITLT